MNKIDWTKPVQTGETPPQAVAMAELDGWKFREVWQGYKLIGWFWCNGEQKEKELPDYTSDLNAIARVEKKLTYDQRKQYIKYLSSNNGAEDCWPQCYLNLEEAAYCVLTTALQRVEAILRSTGRWKD